MSAAVPTEPVYELFIADSRQPDIDGDDMRYPPGYFRVMHESSWLEGSEETVVEVVSMFRIIVSGRTFIHHEGIADPDDLERLSGDPDCPTPVKKVYYIAFRVSAEPR